LGGKIIITSNASNIIANAISDILMFFILSVHHPSQVLLNFI